MYVLRVQDRMFYTLQGRFTGYVKREDDLDPYQSWMICRNVINLDDERECQRKCGYGFNNVIRLMYGSENVFQENYPDKEEQDVELASMISRRIPLNKCLSKEYFCGSADDVQKELDNRINVDYLFGKD